MSKLARISSSLAVPSLLILKNFHQPAGRLKYYRKFEDKLKPFNYSIYTNVSPQVHHQQKPAPCRTCTDFKTWTKIQQKDISFKTDSELLKTYKFDSVKERQESCPIDKDELGRSTWNLLHTMAANYPEKPSQEDASTMKSFFQAFSRIYPCELCAKDFREELKLEPPDLSSQENMSQWLCRLHNRVNIKVGKPIFDCAMVNERWKDGWKDGSCD